MYLSLIILLDRLDAPRDLKVDLRVPGFILLFWSPPFTLDITGNDKDIVRYSVYVNGSETMMQENVTEGLVYIFLCSQNGSYYFSVSGFNLAGEGKRSDAVIGKLSYTGLQLHSYNNLY